MTEQQHNDTLANAINTGVNSQENVNRSFSGQIGDNYFVADLRDDMDFYRFQGGLGDRIEWGIIADGLPWYLADKAFGGILYNANGTILQTSSQQFSGNYAFILPNDGLYYLAVWGGIGRPFSGTFNDVNPTQFPRSIGNAVRTGAYTLNLSLFDNSPNYPAPPPANLAIAPTTATQTEGSSGTQAFTFTITRTGSTIGTHSARWAVTGIGINPSNATDFGGNLPSGTVTFSAGEMSKVVTVNVKGDIIQEKNEQFKVTLSSPTNGATLTTASATGTIQNDDFIGDNNNNNLIGTTNKDYIDGKGGNDTINGLVGADTLIGGLGRDTLTGGSGNDSLYLGSDLVTDTVNYTLGDGSDTVFNFVRGMGGDRLRFSNIAAIDVQVFGNHTRFKVGDGIVGNSGFGTGALLLTTNATNGFVAADVGVNLLGASFAFS